MIKITLEDVTATEYNAEYEDWSGMESSILEEKMQGKGDTLREAFTSLMNVYFKGEQVNTDMLFSLLVNNSVYDKSTIPYMGFYNGQYDVLGDYLIDLYVSVEETIPASIDNLDLK